MHFTTTETAQAAQAATLATARSRRLYEATVSQAAYNLARKIYRKDLSHSGGAGLHLCTLARMDLDEQVERLRDDGALLHFGARVLP